MDIEDRGGMVSISDDHGGLLVPLDFVPVLLAPKMSPLTSEETQQLREEFAKMTPQHGRVQVLDSTFVYSIAEPDDDDSDDGDTPIIVEE